MDEQNETPSPAEMQAESIWQLILRAFREGGGEVEPVPPDEQTSAQRRLVDY